MVSTRPQRLEILSSVVYVPMMVNALVRMWRLNRPLLILSLICWSVMSMKCQGWRLTALGDWRPASRILSILCWGMGVWVYFLMVRRVRCVAVVMRGRV